MFAPVSEPLSRTIVGKDEPRKAAANFKLNPSFTSDFQVAEFFRAGFISNCFGTACLRLSRRQPDLEVSVSHSDRSLRLVARIVAAYVRSNALTAEDLEPLIKSVHASLRALGAPPKSDATADQARAILIRKSVTKDFIICLEDGKKLRRLKRYLRSRYQLTPEAYRAKWGLPPDYPMVAQSYAALRSQYAKKAGLGRVAEPARRRRKA